MTNLFAGKYRADSTRLPGWDYAQAGYYLVTICTKDRVCWFGDICDGEMRLSETGEIVADEWQKTARVRANVKLDEWVIMPNHIHGIVVIMGGCGINWRRDVARNVSTMENVMSKISPTPGSLSAVIRSFKSAATKRIREMGFRNFAWQSRFYDHIIRDERSLNQIRQYIVSNPKNWDEDRNRRWN